MHDNSLYGIHSLRSAPGDDGFVGPERFRHADGIHNIIIVAEQNLCVIEGFDPGAGQVDRRFLAGKIHRYEQLVLAFSRVNA